MAWLYFKAHKLQTIKIDLELEMIKELHKCNVFFFVYSQGCILKFSLQK